MSSSHKYNLVLDIKAINKAVEYVNVHNPHFKWTKESLMNYIHKSVREKLSSTQGLYSTSTAGIYITLEECDEITEKGYPIIEVDVYVSPTFSHKYETIKVR